MRKSRADTAETRKRIVAVASDMLPKLGLAGAPVENIMSAAGMTLGGFYRHFESKEQLIAEASAGSFTAFRASATATTAGMAPREALNAYVALYLNQLACDEVGGRCPLANLGSELRFAGQQVRAAIDEGYNKMVMLFAQELARLGIAYHVSVAESIVTTIVGAVSLSQVIDDVSVSDAVLANAHRAVNILIDAALSV